MAVDMDRRLMIVQMARFGSTLDGVTLRPRVDSAQRVSLGVVLADAECDSARHHQYIRMVLQACSIILAQPGGAGWHIQGVRAQMRQCLPRHEDSQRSWIERGISAVKRQRSARAPVRSLQTQCLQALLLEIAGDIYRLLVRLRISLWRMSSEPHDLDSST
jgi:hypothetical protein